MARAYVGTSGWSYDGWVGPFYMDKLARNQWLAHYAKQLDIDAAGIFLSRALSSQWRLLHGRFSPRQRCFETRPWQAAPQDKDCIE
jgi:hypothetical protein